MYKALFTADWHLSNNLPYAKPCDDDHTNRFDDQLNVIEQIGEVAREEEVDAIFILGDLYDKRLLDAITLKYSIRFLYQLTDSCRQVYILPGNHDANSIKADSYSVDLFSALRHPRIKVLGTERIDVGDCTFCSIPWMSLGETQERLGKLSECSGEDALRVVLLHQSIQGCVSQGWRCDDGLAPSELNSDNSLILSGHFHTPQKFTGGQYIGAPMQFHFGDAGEERGVLVGEFEKGEADFTFREIFSPSFHVQKWPAKSMFKTPLCTGDYVRVEIEATHADFQVLVQEAQEEFQQFVDQEVHVMYQHKPLSQHEVRLENEGPVNHKAAIAKYLEIANTETLHTETLIEVSNKILEEVYNG